MISKRVVVEVPATVANCGPGFDSVGVAIDLVTRIEAILEGEGISVTYQGAWASALEGAPSGADNLLARAFLAAAGQNAPDGISFIEDVESPVGRGFGSSAAAIVGGLKIAEGLGLADGADLLELAVQLEGHPDNVVPCMLGGISITGGSHRMRLDPPSGWMLLLGIAPATSSTSATRTTLPDAFPREMVAEQAGRCALLGAALASGAMDALFEATADRLHQPARLAAMPESADLVAKWRARGLPAFLAGAGPSVAAFVRAQDGALIEQASQDVAEKWIVRPADLRPEGARLIR